MLRAPTGCQCAPSVVRHNPAPAASSQAWRALRTERVLLQPPGFRTVPTAVQRRPASSLSVSAWVSGSHSRVGEPAARELGSAREIAPGGGGRVRLGAADMMLHVLARSVVRSNPLVLLPAAAPPRHNNQKVWGAAVARLPPNVH